MITDLLLITPGFPANERDNTCIPPLQEYLSALRSARPALAISVIATQYPYTITTYVWNGITVFPCDGRNSMWRRPLAWWRAERAWRRVMRQGPPSAVHSLWLGECAMLADRSTRGTSIRHVLTLMGQDARDRAGWWRSMRAPHATVCLSERHAAHFETMTGRGPDAIVPWGIGDGSRSGAAPTRDIDLLFVGSSPGVKRPELFIELVRRINVRLTVRAVMIGRTEKAAPAGGPVMITDELPRNEVLQYMSRSRVLVHTSAFESQGYVFDEALLNGMDIVSFPVGSAGPSQRWRVVHDLDAMEQAVLDLLERPPDDKPVISHPVSATVNEYLKLYGLA
jgi:glycosyltransferase involved in cell wall biosynthesis